MYHKEEELSPIEVAIDEMKIRVSELDEVVSQRVPDLKRLQLKLQGSVSSQVTTLTLTSAQSLFTGTHTRTSKHSVSSWVTGPFAS